MNKYPYLISIIILVTIICGCNSYKKHIPVTMKNHSKLKNVEITFSTLEEKLSHKFKTNKTEFDTIWTLQGKDKIDGDYKIEVISNNDIIAKYSFGYYARGMIELKYIYIELTDSTIVYSYKERDIICNDTLHFKVKI
jgi:hypothetical protein